MSLGAEISVIMPIINAPFRIYYAYNPLRLYERPYCNDVLLGARAMRAKTAVVLGAQWGDEGKGKIVDVLSERFAAVARYAGGHNAGHTVIIGGQKFVLQLIPLRSAAAGVQGHHRQRGGAGPDGVFERSSQAAGKLAWPWMSGCLCRTGRR
jgi:hypothetical protein